MGEKYIVYVLNVLQLALPLLLKIYLGVLYRTLNTPPSPIYIVHLDFRLRNDRKLIF